VKEHWFLLAEDVLLDALKRARKGESPDSIAMELWTNSKHYDDPDDEELVTSQTGITTFTLTVQEDD
jgi:hypothetical protein